MELPTKIIGLPAEDYFAVRECDSRSFYYSVYKYGGEAQRWADMGRSLFGGSTATRTGSKFDALVTLMCEGKSITDALAVPPPEVLASNGSRRGKLYDVWKANCTGIDCSADEVTQLTEMADSLMRNKAAAELVGTTIETQASVFFELNGYPSKVRPDGGTESLWWDLKTTSATWDRVFRSVVDYGYDMQESMYVAGAMACGLSHFRMPFIFVQSMAPYACRVYHLPEHIVAEAGQRLKRVQEEVALRRATQEYYPAEHGDIIELEIPAWATKKESELVYE